MDMDIDDIDLCVDPINTYLLNKLDNAKKLNEEMKGTVRDLESFIGILQEAKQCDAALEVGEVWKRIFNGKYVFGIDVKNNYDGNLLDIQCILQWKSVISSLYNTQIYSSEENTFVNALKPHKDYTIILIVDQIDFSRYSEYSANCKIFYQFTGQQRQTSIENITFCASDFGTSAEIKGLDLEVGNRVSVLAGMSAQNHLALVARLMGNASRHLENYLTVDCMLRVTEFDRFTFVFERISEAVDKSILRYNERDGIYYVDIFYRDKLCLRHILHHLHKNIKQLYLLPCRYEHELRKVKFDDNFGTQMFVSQLMSDIDRSEGGALKNNLLDHMKLIRDFQLHVLECDGVDESTDVTVDFSNIRNALGQKELKSDIAFENLE